MIGALMLAALLACAIAVALWERTYGRDLEPSRRRSRFIVRNARFFYDGVEVEGVMSATFAFREAGEAAKAFGDALRAKTGGTS